MCTDFLLFVPKPDPHKPEIPEEQKPAATVAVAARSMEFFGDTVPNLEFNPAGTEFTSAGGEKWIVKYSYIAINANNQLNEITGETIPITNDGLNYKGLSVGGLWLAAAGYVEVETPEHKPQKGIHYIAFPDYLLGNYKNVQQVIDAVNGGLTIWVDKTEMASTNFIPSLHFSVHDKHGCSAVIEFISGKAFVYKNTPHVLTNDPEFPWHFENIKYYASLIYESPDVEVEGKLYAASGAGLRGIPGDIYPPSRFIRTFYQKKFVEENMSKIKDVPFDAVNVAHHLLNNVDIPMGVCKQYQPPPESYLLRLYNSLRSQGEVFEQTRWVFIKDLINLKVYYRTYLGLGYKIIDLQQVKWDDPELTKNCYKMEDQEAVNALPLPVDRQRKKL